MEIRREAAASLTASRLAQTSILVHDGRSPCRSIIGVPCAAPTPQADASGKAPCGPVAYSAADQRYSGVPCTAPTPKADASGKAPCGAVAYSNAEQRYVGVPCPHQ